jgi:hypothetical protein
MDNSAGPGIDLADNLIPTVADRGERLAHTRRSKAEPNISVLTAGIAELDEPLVFQRLNEALVATRCGSV